jgi:hypothetical protein
MRFGRSGDPMLCRFFYARLICYLVVVNILCAMPAQADTEYYRHIIFDNSLESDAYYYTDGRAESPSTLELQHGKLPVSRDVFLTPPNALRLKWRSAANGGWEASVRAMDFRNRELKFSGDTLFLWCYTLEGIPGRDLPMISLLDVARDFSRPRNLGDFVLIFPLTSGCRSIFRSRSSRLDQFTRLIPAAPLRCSSVNLGRMEQSTRSSLTKSKLMTLLLLRPALKPPPP